MNGARGGYVIDASVAVKWVVPEAGTAQALALRRHALYAPDLLIAECANILWKKQQRGELTTREASMAARLLERVELGLMPMRRLLDRATALAIELDHPAYDCIYLACAEVVRRPFVTADTRLLRKLAGGAAASIEVAALETMPA